MISPKRKYSLFPSATRKSGRVRCVPRECYPGRTVGRDRFLQSTLLIKDEGSVQSHDVGDGCEQAFRRRPRQS
jgi:hypothetical protein